METIIIKCLISGKTQVEIAQEFSNNGIEVSLSTIEKKINKIKKNYNAKSLCELGYLIAKMEAKTEKKPMNILSRILRNKFTKR